MILEADTEKLSCKTFQKNIGSYSNNVAPTLRGV
jgi:hypothetical protein